MAMQLKLDPEGHAVLQEGKPVYVHDDGKETSFDVPDMYARLVRDGKTTGELRKSNGELQEKLKVFDGLDPEAARKAIDLVANLDSGKLLTAGKAEEVRAAANKAAEEKVASVTKTLTDKLAATEADREKYRTQLHNEKIRNEFANSSAIKEKVAYPPRLLISEFGPKFGVDDDGNVFAKGVDGQPIQSLIKFGSPAKFDEAIMSLINDHADRDQILKGANQSGSGSRPSANGSTIGGKKTITRADFDRLGPAEQRAAAIGKDAVQVVD